MESYRLGSRDKMLLWPVFIVHFILDHLGILSLDWNTKQG